MREFLSDLKEFVFCVILPVAALVAVIIIICVAALIYIESSTCSQLQEINPDYEFRFDFPSGCKMKTSDGLFISIDKIQYINGEIKTP